ncbi:hypothetical protein MGWOODY_XGa2852 [hydrothermal vent metagenome]|uniref:Uncharacterized protein n=1 Tax=hydrothermal vent metagenome TaxID=652676 RepID=A0A161K6I4_9ZZZZ
MSYAKSLCIFRIRYKTYQQQNQIRRNYRPGYVSERSESMLTRCGQNATLKIGF